MRVDLNHRLTFPVELAVTNLRPDLVLWSKSIRTAITVELTVPWEEAINEAFERKKLRYAILAAEAEERGWAIKVYPVEVGCRGFVANSTIRLLKEVGIRGQVLWRLVGELATVAERSSHWLWLKQMNSVWAAKWLYNYVTHLGLISLWWACLSWGCLVIKGRNTQWGLGTYKGHWQPKRLRVWVSGPAGIVGGGSECPALSPPSIPWLRCPWARHRTPNCSPGAAA